MSWTATQRASVAPKDLFDLATQHRLMPRDMMSAAQNYKMMASLVQWWDIEANGEKAADVLILVSPAGIAALELVPLPEYFAPSVDFKDGFREAMLPVVRDTFGGKYEVRRITSEVPFSRGRTKKALVALGFRFEGKARLGVQFYGKEPEDTYLLAMLPEYLKED